MIELLIIADDLTGALDTGVQFAKKDIATKVVVGTDCDFSDDISVLVVDAETRHLSPERAGETVKRVVKDAVSHGVERFYKKTDSALRGNIGSELEALLSETGERTLYFAPAFPKANRITKNGVHYVGGIPVSDSVFGKDPFEPVKDSEIATLIARQSSTPVHRMESEEDPPINSIALFDAADDNDLATAAELCKRKNARVLAGCAGFAEFLPDIFDLSHKPSRNVKAASSVIVVSGSLNPVTEMQVKTAADTGIPCFTLSQEQIFHSDYTGSEAFQIFLKKFSEKLKKKGMAILGADGGKSDFVCDEERQSVSENIGKIVKGMLESGMLGTYVIVGGDTLLSVMRQTECRILTPITEVAPGIVLSQTEYKKMPLAIISKSGGLGEKNAFLQIRDYVKEAEEEKHEA